MSSSDENACFCCCCCCCRCCRQLCCSPRVGLSTCREIKQVCPSVCLSVSVWSIEGQAGPAGDEDPDPKRSTHTSAHVWQQKRPEHGDQVGSWQARPEELQDTMAGLGWSILCCQTSAPGCGGPQNTPRTYGPMLPVLVANRRLLWCCGAMGGPSLCRCPSPTTPCGPSGEGAKV